MESEGTVSDKTREGSSFGKLLQSGTHQETETERLVRLGEMTPFGSAVATSSDNACRGITRTDQFINENTDGNVGCEKDDAIELTNRADDITHNTARCSGDLADVHHSDLTCSILDEDKDDVPLTSDNEETLNIPSVDSDEDYIPDDEELKLSLREDERFMLEPVSVEPVDDATVKTKKRRSGKTSKEPKKTKRVNLNRSVKDDGDDRTYQIRIRYEF